MSLKYFQENMLEIINPADVNYIKVCVTENAEHYLQAQLKGGKLLNLTQPTKFESTNNLIMQFAKLLGREYMSHFSPMLCEICVFSLHNFDGWSYDQSSKTGKTRVVAQFKNGQELEVFNLGKSSLSSMQASLAHFEEQIKKEQEIVNLGQ